VTVRVAEIGDDLALLVESKTLFDFEIDRFAAEHFWPYVRKSDQCWIWMRSLTREKYGQVWFRGQNVLTHRFAFLFANDYLTPGLVVDHLCTVLACVRPSHLEEVPHAVNVRRGSRPHFELRGGFAA
jgi:hypothetical protein